jgi:hypothetical protein
VAWAQECKGEGGEVPRMTRMLYLSSPGSRSPVVAKVQLSTWMHLNLYKILMWHLVCLIFCPFLLAWT